MRGRTHISNRSQPGPRISAVRRVRRFGPCRTNWHLGRPAWGSTQPGTLNGREVSRPGQRLFLLAMSLLRRHAERFHESSRSAAFAIGAIPHPLSDAAPAIRCESAVAVLRWPALPVEPSPRGAADAPRPAHGAPGDPYFHPEFVLLVSALVAWRRDGHPGSIRPGDWSIRARGGESPRPASRRSSAPTSSRGCPTSPVAQAGGPGRSGPDRPINPTVRGRFD